MIIQFTTFIYFVCYPGKWINYCEISSIHSIFISFRLCGGGLDLVFVNKFDIWFDPEETRKLSHYLTYVIQIDGIIWQKFIIKRGHLQWRHLWRICYPHTSQTQNIKVVFTLGLVNKIHVKLFQQEIYQRHFRSVIIYSFEREKKIDIFNVYFARAKVVWSFSKSNRHLGKYFGKKNMRKCENVLKIFELRHFLIVFPRISLGCCNRKPKRKAHHG